MGDGSTRRSSTPQRRQDEAHDARADGQFDLFGALPSPDDAHASSHDAADTDDARAHATRAPRAPKPARPSTASDAGNAARDDEAAAPPSTGMLWDDPAPPPEPRKRARRRGVPPAPVAPEVAAAAAALPPNVRLGTSSWYFPGWNGIVFDGDFAQTKLSREGLEAYGAHPLLKSVSLDRSFYAPLSVADYLRYAQQVPDDFRFVVKAPASVTDAVVRGHRGEPSGPNPTFLDASLAADEFVRPCLEGLGKKAGVLVFQFSPLPDRLLAEPAALIERLSAFFAALPPLPPEADGPRYAIEIRDASLLTPRFIRTLAAHGVRYCVGLHARMPDPLRQAAALALLDGDAPGPLIVRWSLHGGFKYEQAKAKYEPFDKLVDEDPATRSALAELAARYALAGQPVIITINNKAEGSAPLSCIALAREIAAACARWRSEAA
ncbi:DUF72 domain-containing protein [Burkholderia multivorans]|uniref:DUF72 domain-containing protein n=1 Tax=Burkholderia multivorans TaxID=87883 RepID=A0A8E2UTH3_9BURK|nr:DUF72 domain-containing protein [Burkholderia multivorans]MCA8261135.1 DUF72 domain-containing protein [Burkholderia multivorans]MCL4626417.1 DUF72 domain-containing protein [Burkholderia multivorans]MCO1361674.1 DUF72 domain-containing protein [Burkholderia multivorans]MCO1381339.1 DUF72 domain-containing protein [Burkholderia multivorans]MCO1386506.1 DUF72 domain-containing protein [Burkholderia multivorans]